MLGNELQGCLFGQAHAFQGGHRLLGLLLEQLGPHPGLGGLVGTQLLAPGWDWMSPSSSSRR